MGNSRSQRGIQSPQEKDFDAVRSSQYVFYAFYNFMH